LSGITQRGTDSIWRITLTTLRVSTSQSYFIFLHCNRKYKLLVYRRKSICYMLKCFHLNHTIMNLYVTSVMLVLQTNFRCLKDVIFICQQMIHDLEAVMYNKSFRVYQKRTSWWIHYTPAADFNHSACRANAQVQLHSWSQLTTCWIIV